MLPIKLATNNELIRVIARTKANISVLKDKERQCKRYLKFKTVLQFVVIVSTAMAMARMASQ